MRQNPIARAALACAVLGLCATTQAPRPRSPIRHLVIIYQENNSFDHYFATYPHATNPPGEPPFHALPGTPPLAGLAGTMLTANPNLDPANGPDATNPFRLDRSEAATVDQDHSYTQEQLAYNHGKMNLFPSMVGHGGPPPGAPALATHRSLNLGYYDGNTVTALWNYAQRFGVEDHFFQSTFGPSVLGAINLVSGQTNGVVAVRNGTSPNVVMDGGDGSFTVMGDADPVTDICSSPTRVQLGMGGRNIGNLLNDAHVSWGWFQQGFNLSVVNDDNTTGCNRDHKSEITGVKQKDYVTHHEPFQYYASTANPTHVRPTSPAMVGKPGDAANHQYDMADLYTAIAAGNFPTVTFIKPPAYENGHSGNSDPLDEQHFLVHLINYLQQTPEWPSTAIIITWDDSDGWYDHVAAPVVNSSVSNEDVLNGDGLCGDGKAILPGINPRNLHAVGRCGYGPRVPFLLLSPWAKQNYVDSDVTDQSSILRLIEDQFLDARRLGEGSFDGIAGSLEGLFDFTAPPRLTPLILDEKTGEPAANPAKP